MQTAIVPCMTHSVRNISVISCFFFLHISIYLWIISLTRLTSNYALVAKCTAIWVVIQSFLAYMGDSYEFIICAGHGKWVALDRIGALITFIGTSFLATFAYVNGDLSVEYTTCALFLFFFAIVSWSFGVIILRCTESKYSAQHMPNLWGLCHSFWHLFASLSGFVIIMGLKPDDEQA